MGAAHTVPAAQGPQVDTAGVGSHAHPCDVDLAQIRRRDATELQHLKRGYLPVCMGFSLGPGRVQIPSTAGSRPHLGRRLLEDLTALHELLLILSDEELYWVEFESQCFAFSGIGPLHMPRQLDPVFDEHLESQLQEWYGQHYEDRFARRVKSSATFGWCVPPAARIFSSFILAHEVSPHTSHSVQSHCRHIPGKHFSLRSRKGARLLSCYPTRTCMLLFMCLSAKRGSKIQRQLKLQFS